jgi:hypothetical protein
MLPPGAMPMPPTCAASASEIVAVEPRRGDDAVLGRTRENLLQERVGITSLITRPSGSLHQGPPSNSTAPNSRQIVAPVTKCPFGEFHDVAFVHEREALRRFFTAHSSAARINRSLPRARWL